MTNDRGSSFRWVGTEREQHAAHEHSEHDDLDTERRRTLPRNHEQDAAHERDDKQHERLAGAASMPLR
jgi:hypothetical protein